MKSDKVISKIENSIKKELTKNSKLKNAYLLVESDKLDIHINIAEGKTREESANPKQPNYMASVGKLFTAAIIGILADKNKLEFSDNITKFLDTKLTDRLHIYEGIDYSDKIKISHLLNHSSGLSDNFWPLLNEVVKDENQNLTPVDAINWVKKNTKAHFAPGEGFKYTDTNYHLLGLIIENITGNSFHEVLKKYIFEPLGMNHSYMNHYSEPIYEPKYPTADFYYKGKKLNDIKNYAKIDYAGGGVIAPTEDLLKFMKALVSYQIVKKETLNEMKSNCSKFGLGMDYGYGILKITTVPIVMPKKFNSWGVAGATGAFMFYHPNTDSYIIGNFNDFDYEQKGVRFMLLNVINQLTKI